LLESHLAEDRNGLTFLQNLNIASSTAHRIYKQFEETEVEGKKPQSRENLRKLSVRDELFIIGLILGNPVLYLEEICREVDKVLGKQVSAPTVCHLHGFTRKKVQAIAKQRSDKFRGAFIAEMHCYSRDQCGLTRWVVTEEIT